MAAAQPSSTGNFPVVADSLALMASANAAYPAGVLRADYAAGNGAPPMLFLPQRGACAANGLVNDGGSCVDGTAGDGNSWKAQPGPELDWREFGVSASRADNRPYAQAALDAGYRSGLPVGICGAGFYKTSTLYFYPNKVAWCDHKTVLQRIAAGPVMVLVDRPGRTYETSTTLVNAHLIRPTIDMNASLMMTAGGAGIVISDVNNWEIHDPNVWNIPAMTTPAPAVSGAPHGTFAYADQRGTGWVANAGIALLGGGNVNVENGRITGGFVGNFALDGDGYPTAFCAHRPTPPAHGSTGILLSNPSQDMGLAGGDAGGPGVANANIISGTIASCDAIGFRNDYPSANRFVNTDATWAGLVGYAIGTYGRYDLTLGGTPGGISEVAVTFMAASLTGSPVTVSYSGTGTPTAMAAGLAGAINRNAALSAYGITAGLWPGTATIHVDYGDEFSAHQTAGSDMPFNIALCDGTLNCGVGGTITLKPFYQAGWNFLSQFSSEDDGVAAVYLGANARGNVIDLPQQVSGSHAIVMHQHAGPSGSNMTVVTNNVNTFNSGTPKSRDFAVDCNNEPQPYIVDTGSGPVTGTFVGDSEGGTKCEFVDGTQGGGWAAHPFTLKAPAASWGHVAIRGRSSLALTTDFGDVTMKFMRFNNSTLKKGSNAGGDWR